MLGLLGRFGSMESPVSNSGNRWVRESKATRNIVIGTAALALGSYTLLAFTSRQLSPYEYSLFAAFWSVIMGLILGATAPLETFGLSTTIVKNDELQIDKQFVAAIRIVLITVSFSIIFVLPWSIPRVFDGRWSFLIATILALLGFVLTYSARGVLVVGHRSRMYATLMSLESFLRIALAALFIALIGAGGSSIALAISLAAVIVGSVSYISIRKHIALRNITTRKSKSGNQSFVPLLVASLATLLLLNLGPFVVQFLAGAAATTAGPFLNALTISRAPIMLGPVLQARLVPSVVSILSQEDFPTLGKLIGKGIRVLIAFGLVFVIGFALCGGWVISILFGSDAILGRLDLALLAIPTFLYLLAVAFQSVLVALGQTKKIALAWIVGLIAYLIALTLPFEPVQKVEVAGVIAMVTVSSSLFLMLSKAMKAGAHALELPT